ncbi:MAG: FliM/FliN family flagellar motor switch protein [Candidatus Gastranaerophilales bacterium]|nr:FliM/FliN family flagellar motor switch protein [Candidatus Gastranaerophilales bacterium]
MADIIYKKENVFHDLNFEGFWLKLTESIKDAVERYWETETVISLFALSDYKNIRDEFFVKNSDFFSSQIRIDHHRPVLVRLDTDFINNFLCKTLESTAQNQELKTLTPLEVKILNNFCEYLYRQIQELLIPPKQAKLSARSEKNINLLFHISAKEGTCSKFMLSIPQDRINMVKLEHKIAFTDEDFINSAAYVRIRAGYTKLTLEELQNLSKDDIILLDDSSISKLTLVSGDVEKDFKVEIDESMVLNLDSDEENEESEYEVKMEKNLWDDIQIELSAEFSKVKMTIGELKQITRGQVVDLGSVFDNEISLYIENKKVAKGELLIINDKYAVRLNEVLSSNVPNNPAPAKKEVKQQPPKQAPTQQGAPQAPAGQPVEDEEFDYSDFEN